ncbi:PAS domain-containing protein [Paenibacillus konkukensis]|nr:PAS domain S-box protein [Paenibacillus konkukensis]
MHPDHPSFFEHAFSLAPIGIAIASIGGEWQKVNRALCDMLGYGEQELCSIDYREITYPDDLALAEWQIQQLLEGRFTSYCIEMRHYRRNGSVIWTSRHVSLIRNEDDQPYCFYIHLTDISDRKHSDQVYSTVFEHSQDIITFNSLDGTCLYVSPAVKSLLGYEPEEMVGRQQHGLLHPDDKQGVLERAYADTDKICARYRHARGHYVWFETSIKLIRDEQGEPWKIMGVGRDVTERIEAEQALLKSERALAEAQKIASIGSWEWDIPTSQVIWSDELLRICELRREDFAHTYDSLKQFIHPDDLGTVRKLVQRAINGEPYSLECRIVTARGNDKYVHIQGIVLTDERGNPCKMLGTAQDITERKKMELLLEETIDRYTSLKKYNPDAVISLDKLGYIVSVNPAAQNMSGYSATELGQLHFTDLVYGLNDDKMRAEAWYQRFMRGEMSESEEVRVLHKDGSVLDLLVTPAPIFVRREMVGCYIMMKDITMQKRKDELLRQSEKLSVVGQLAAGVAHEIRNPLTALKGFIKLMMHSGQQFPKYLGIMKEELERIELIVSELLMLSKPQSVHLRCVNLKELTEEVRALIGTQAIMRGIEIDLESDLEHVPLYCDPNQIKQVIINFLKNAIEATGPDGAVCLHLKNDEGGGTLLRIIDQGCGIPEDKINRVGEPFFTTKEGGTGLGIMISRKIIEHHGGTMAVHSKVNEGTVIEVRFPVPDMQPVQRAQA